MRAKEPAPESGFISAISLNSLVPSARSSGRWPWAPCHPSFAMCGTAWRTKASTSTSWSGVPLSGSEQGVDQLLQTQMLRDGSDFNGNPATAVLLTGDGRGFSEGAGFHADLERMRLRGWRIEVLSWRHSCARRMREWAIEHGVFIALDDYYESVTFLESPPQGHLVADPRFITPLDLARRPRA